MSKKILIIEDDKDLVEIMKIHLTNQGYQVEYAYDGEDGLKKIETFKPDLIILDIMLPKLDGVTLNAKLKTDNDKEAYKTIPVIAITGRVGIKELLVVHNQLTVSAFFYKPVSLAELLTTIKKLLKEE